MAARRTRTLVLAGASAVLVALAAVPAVWYLDDRADRQRLHAAVEAFATAWRTGALERPAYSGLAAAEVARRVSVATAALTPAPKDAPSGVEVEAVSGPHDDRASAELAVRWELAGKRTWSYRTTLPLVRSGGAWQVVWSPSVIHPKLGEGQVLAAQRVTAARGRILGSGGQVLVTERPVVMVGIQPSRTTDRRATVAAVAAVVDVDAAALRARVLAAAPSAFVDVITLRQADYQAVQARLQPIPGTVFRSTTLSLAPSPTFARAVLGTAGQATADIVKESGGRVQPGDVTGLSGVQRRYDEQLAGTTGLTVTAAAANGSGQPVTLFSAPAVAGRDLRLSLDETVQIAAERALAKAPKPAGLVAIRPSTGEVLAVANGPAGAAGYNRALIGRYPPGSTFKIATTYGLLRRGLTTATPVPCPPTLNVGGRVFQNAEDEKFGTVPFSTDFAQSCNTAFVGLSRRLSSEQLHDAAAALGYGRPNTLGVDAFTGSVPTSGDLVAKAAASIGQGTVLASPLAVATATASVASGRYVAPRLVLGAAPSSSEPAATASTGDAPGTVSPTDPAGETPGETPGETASRSPVEQGSAGPAASTSTADTSTAGSPGAPGSSAGEPLDAVAVAQLQTLTGLVVTSGTGSALRGVPGGPVHGKTGTAEFGSANPPLTHAWFTGYQGDLAFAIVVEGGGFGGKVAAPLAAAFLTDLA